MENLGSRTLISIALTAALMAAAGPALADSGARPEPPDTVLLQDGGRVRGRVMTDEASGVSVMLADGTTKVVPRAKVLRVEYAEPPASAPAPEAPAAAAPPPPESVAPTPTVALVATPPVGDVARPSLRPLWITGLVTFGVSYSTTIIVNAAIADKAHKGTFVGEAAVPLAGPFINIAQGGSHLTGAEKGGLVAAGVLQTFGAAAFLVGIAYRPRQAEAAPYVVAPVAVRGGGGLQVGGSF